MSTRLVACIPARFGWYGAAAPTGTVGFTQRRTGSLQVSWLIPAEYAATKRARSVLACVASSAFNSFSFARRYGTSA